MRLPCLQNFAEAIEQAAACDAIFARGQAALTSRQKQEALPAQRPGQLSAASQADEFAAEHV